MNEAARPSIPQRLRQRDGVRRRLVAPSLGQDFPVASVEAEDQARTEAGSPRCGNGWRFRGSRPYDHTRDTSFQGGFDLRNVARATTGLHRYPRDLHDFSDDVEMAPAAEPGSVQVNDVQPGGTSAGKTAGQRHRVRPEVGDAGEVALLEPHRVPAEQVDRRDDQHPANSADNGPSVIVLAY